MELGSDGTQVEILFNVNQMTLPEFYFVQIRKRSSFFQDSSTNFKIKIQVSDFLCRNPIAQVH